MADTSYEIGFDVDAAGISSASQALDSLASSTLTAGSSSTQLEAALARVSAQSTAAAAAASSAAAAVAAGEASYAASEVAADRASRALERHQQKIAEAKGAVGDLAAARARLAQVQMGDESGAVNVAEYQAAKAAVDELAGAQRRLNGLLAGESKVAASAAAASAALAEEGAALDALKASAASAEAAHEGLAASATQLEGELKQTAAAEKKVADEAAGSGKVNELGEAFGKLGGPLGSAGQKLFGMADGLKKMTGSAGSGVGAIAGLTVVVVAVAAAMAYAVVKTAAWAVGLADAARSAALTTEALSRTSPSLSGIGNIIPSVAAKTGLAADALQDLAKQLSDAKVSAADMPAALEAAAIAEAALGKGGAADLVKDLKEGKKSASALAAEMKSKFGDIVAKKLLSLDAQAATLKGNLSETFGGLNIEGLLGGLSKLIGLLDSSSSSGKALKFLFETIFQPLIDAAVAAIPTIERLFLGAVIGALKLYIALKPAIKAIGELTGAADEGDGSFNWLAAGEIVVYAAATAIGILVAAVGLAAAPFYAMYSAVKTTWDLIAGIDWSAIGSAITGALSGIDLAGLGSSMVVGLVNGLLGGLPGVVSAMLSLGSAAIAALKSKLSIASPSKVFESFGGFTAEGFQKGIEGGTEDAQGAVDSMVGAPGAAGAPGAVAAAGGGKPAAVNLEGVTFNFYGVKDAQQGEGRLRDALRDILEGGFTPVSAT